MVADPRRNRDFLAFALDLRSKAQALHYVKQLNGKVGVFKIGTELFIRTGPDVVHAIQKIPMQPFSLI